MPVPAAPGSDGTGHDVGTGAAGTERSDGTATTASRHATAAARHAATTAGGIGAAAAADGSRYPRRRYLNRAR